MYNCNNNFVSFVKLSLDFFFLIIIFEFVNEHVDILWGPVPLMVSLLLHFFLFFLYTSKYRKRGILIDFKMPMKWKHLFIVSGRIVSPVGTKPHFFWIASVRECLNNKFKETVSVLSKKTTHDFFLRVSYCE